MSVKETQDKTEQMLDAARLLYNAALQQFYFDQMDEGISIPCKTEGELILQDALFYLSCGDTHNARPLLDLYDEWKRTGEAPWPYDPTKPTPTELMNDEED